ncbi:MAG: glycosyltransferase family 39 protein, partial [bacterium]|nr:glycosyltransferase family 39 protein [Candidatus Kapabacteria bacterium]
MEAREPHRPSGRFWIITSTLVVLILSPLFFFLLSPDQALFHVSGQKILQGAVHYRDIVDVKPPLIYHVYALAILLFGNSEAASHILDFILQVITCGLLAAIIRRASNDDVWAAAAACSYGIIYVSLSSGSTGLAESYTGILALPAVWLLMYRRTTTAFVLVGVLCGLLFVLKYTLAIVLGAAIIAELLVSRVELRAWLRSSALMIAGFAIVMALFAVYIVGLGALPGLREMNEFLGSYIQLSGPSPRDWISHTMIALPTYLGEGYTLTYLIATVGGIVLSLRMQRDDESTTQRLLRVCTIAFILLFISVLIETRYGGGSFSRLLPFGIPLATYAALRFMRRMK